MAMPNFRLASLLNLREAQLTEAMQEMARIEAQVLTLQSALEQVGNERDATLHRSVPVNATRAADLGLATQYLAWLEQRELRLRHELDQIQAALARARVTVMERHQAAEVLRRLRERHNVAVREDEGRRERRAVDELATLQVGLQRQNQREE